MKSRQTIIKEQGERWTIANRAAFLVIRQDPRFIGIDKLRDPMIDRAAFLACTGEAPACPFLARVASCSAPGYMAEIDALIELAAAAARQALLKHDREKRNNAA